MPQNDSNRSRAGQQRTEVRLAERDILDLELVRRRLQDATFAPDLQGQLVVILSPAAAVFAMETVERVLMAPRVHKGE